jgi:hypothetical protein
LARFVYLDEAGTGGEPWLVVGGVIVHGDHQPDNLCNALAEILEKHVPAELREGGLVIHSCDVYGGTKKFDKKRIPYWTPWENRAAILTALGRLHGLRVQQGCRDQEEGLAVVDSEFAE